MRHAITTQIKVLPKQLRRSLTWDQETGLYYFGARYYDPRLQLWQSPDPALESYMDGSPNGGVFAPVNLGTYTYAANNPIRLNDPDGRWVNIAIGAGIGLLVGVGIEGVRQAYRGEFNAGRLAGAAAAGVIPGGVAGATMGASLVVQGSAAVGAGVTGGVVSRAISGEAQTVEAVATDAVVSGVTFGVVKGGGAIIRSVRGTPAPAAAPAPTTPTVRPATMQPMGGGGRSCATARVRRRRRSRPAPAARPVGHGPVSRRCGRH